MQPERPARDWTSPLPFLRSLGSSAGKARRRWPGRAREADSLVMSDGWRSVPVENGRALEESRGEDAENTPNCPARAVPRRARSGRRQDTIPRLPARSRAGGEISGLAWRSDVAHMGCFRGNGVDSARSQYRPGRCRSGTIVHHRALGWIVPGRRQLGELNRSVSPRLRVCLGRPSHDGCRRGGRSVATPEAWRRYPSGDGSAQ